MILSVTEGAARTGEEDMTRVAGSREAKKAWAVLRGPYLLSYVLLLALAFTVIPGGREGQWWRVVIFIVGTGLIVGATSSYMVVSHREPKDLWRRLEALEVSGLKVLVAFQGIYGAWLLLLSRVPAEVTIVHWIIGALALGILSNMSWRKGHASG